MNDRSRDIHRNFRWARAFPAALILGLFLSATAAMASPAPGQERRASFNDGWRFHLGDLPDAQQPAFLDATWKTLRLPHDWAIDGPFDAKLNPHTGALPVSGIGWYRKSFTLPASAKQSFCQQSSSTARCRMRASG